MLYRFTNLQYGQMKTVIKTLKWKHSNKNTRLQDKTSFRGTYVNGT